MIAQRTRAAAQQHRRRLASAASALALAAAFTVSAGALAPATAQEAAKPITVAAGPLDAAILELAQKTGISVYVPSELAAGRTARPVSGSMTSEEALRRLLAGSGLTFRRNSDGSYLVVMAPTKAVSQAVQVPAGDAGSVRAAEPAPAAIEEVIVTATKRAESLHDVPIAITALGREHIEQTGSENLQDLASSIPNFVWPNGYVPNQADISIRGIYSIVVGEAVGFDQGFGVYLDGVYMGKQNALNVDLGPIERVEVLRGPQGTLFGKNTIAGAINIISTQPSTEFGGELTAEAGNYDLRRFRGSINVPLVADVLAARLSLATVQRDGYVTNLTTANNDVGNLDQKSGRLQLRYTPTAATDIQLNLDKSLSDSDFYFVEYVQDDNRRYTIFTDVTDRSKQDNRGASLNIQHEFADGPLGGFVATSITGVRKDKAFSLLDLEGSPLDAFNFEYTATQKLISQELRLASPAGRRYDFVAGLYYFDQKNDVAPTFHAGQAWLGFLGPDWTGKVFMEQSVDALSYAAFFHANFRLNDEITLFGGARYTYEKKEMVSHPTSCTPAALCSNFGIPAGVQIPAPVNLVAREPSWTLGLRYKPTRDVMAYGSISTGFKSGAFNNSSNPVRDFAAQNLIAEPEYVTSYEVGAKSRWLNGRMTANFAAFYMDYTDLQVRTWCPDCGTIIKGVNILSNAASVTSKGFEAELVLRPTEALMINAGVGYVDSKFDRFEGVTDARPISEGGLGIIDASGNRVPLAPKWTINVAAQYEAPLSSGAAIIARADYRFTDDRFSAAGVANTSDQLLPSHSLVDARISYRSPDSHWRLAFWGKNLTDVRTPTNSVFLSFIKFGLTQQYMEPRTYGISLDYSF
ncbi:MAG: TonB-dependent receptor [Phenylobacterium sp.]|uniref:TonB-dependent receptor domain-containing protein n=1 Tax=Phenylobacterium sp. TaxID=1871053 RepID=UPI00273378C5|nr:TonB-dependent receptor [Phenylobacterium sp.]MDP3746680.1 TonB-dependent receptor [Phenylobacterium sp.]